MKRKILFVLMFLFLVSNTGCITRPFIKIPWSFKITRLFIKGTPEQIAKNSYRKELIKKKKLISRIKSNPYLYVGEGVSKIGKSVSDAIKSASKMAKKELAESIKMRIKLTIVDVLGKKSETSDEWFESKTESYSDIVFRDLKGRDFLYYPDNKTVTYLYWISKKEYKLQVDEDLKRKKETIMGFLNEGMSSYKKEDFGNALSNYFEANKKLIRYFDGSPVEEHVKGDTVELNSFIHSQIIKIIENIRITPLDKVVMYDVKGVPRKNPSILVEALNKKGQSFPVHNLALLVKFEKGNGQLYEDVRSDINGIAIININHINPKFPDALLKVGLNLKKMGASESSKDWDVSPSTQVKLIRIQTIALTVKFFNGNTVTVPNNFVADLKSNLLEDDFGIVDFNIRSDKITKNEIRKADELNVDYLLVIVIKAKTGGPDITGMFWGTVSSNATLFSIPDGAPVFTFQGPSAEGEHIDRSSAGWDAFAKIQNNLLKKVNRKIMALNE